MFCREMECEGSSCFREVPFLPRVNPSRVSNRKSHRPGSVQGTASPYSGLTSGQHDGFLFLLSFGRWLSLGAVLLDTGCYRGCEHDVMASRGGQLFCSCVCMCLGCRQPPCVLWLGASQGHTEDWGSSPSGFTSASELDLGRQAHTLSPQAQLYVPVENIRETSQQVCRSG